MTAAATDDSMPEITMPNAGTPLLEMRLSRCGNRPSLAAASGISALIMIQPFSAPKPEMMTAIAMTSPHTVLVADMLVGAGEPPPAWPGPLPPE